MKLRLRSILVVLLLSQLIGYTDKPGRMYVLNFRESPISNVMDLYSQIQNTSVTITPGTYSTITLISNDRIPDSVVISMIESSMVKSGVTLTKSQDGIIIEPASGLRHTASKSVEIISTNIVIEIEEDLNEPTTGSSTITNRAPMSKEETRFHLLEYRKQLMKVGLPQPPLSDLEKELGITEADKPDFQHAPPEGRGEAPRP